MFYGNKPKMLSLFRDLEIELNELEKILDEKLKREPDEGFDFRKSNLNQLPLITHTEFITVTYLKVKIIQEDLEKIKSQYLSLIVSANKSQGKK